MVITRPPPRILFVHNSAPDPRHIKHLTEAGFLVAEASPDGRDGAGIVARAIEFRPDIIVLDFSADGEVTHALKGHETTKGIPIIALAALAEDPPDPS